MADESLVLKLSANLDEFKSSIAGGMQSWGGFMDLMGSGPGVFVGVAAAVAAVGAGAFAMASKAAAAGEELANLSEKTGVTVEKLSLLKFVASQTDTDIQTIGSGFVKLGKAMEDANKPGSDAALTFEALGVSVKNADGSMRTLDDVLLDVAAGIKETEDPTLKMKMAMELFGKAAGPELIPMLNEGRDGITAFMDEGRAAGLELSTTMATDAQAFGDAIAAFKMKFEAIGISIGTDLMVPFTALIDWLGSAAISTINSIKLAFDLFQGTALALAIAIQGVIAAGAAMTDFMGLTTGAADAANKKLEELTGQMGALGEKAAGELNNIAKAYGAVEDKTNDLVKAEKERIKKTEEQKRATLDRKEAEEQAGKAAKKAGEQEKEGRKIAKEAVELYGRSQENLGKMLQENEENLQKAFRESARVHGEQQEQEGRNIVARYQLERAEILATEKQNGLTQEQMGKDILASTKTMRDEFQAVEDKAKKAAEESAKDWAKWFALTGDGSAGAILTTFGHFAEDTWLFVKGSFAAATADMLLNGGDFTESMKEIWGKIKTAFVTMLVEMGVEEVGKLALHLSGWEAYQQARVLAAQKANAEIAASNAGATGAGATGAGAAGAGAAGTGGAAAGPSAAQSIATAAAAIFALGQLNQMEGGFWSPDVGEHLENKWGFGQGRRDAEGRNRTANRFNFLLSELPNAPSVDAVEELERLITLGGSDSWLWHDVSVDLDADAATALLKLLSQAKQILTKKGMLHGGIDWATVLTTFDATKVTDWHFNKENAPPPAQRQGGPVLDLGRITDRFRPFAEGGLITGPTLGLLGEAGYPEMVLPLSRAVIDRAIGTGGPLNGALGGGGTSIGEMKLSLSFPGITDFGNLTIGKAEELLKTTFSTAAENLARSGYRWPMQPA